MSGAREKPGDEDGSRTEGQRDGRPGQSAAAAQPRLEAPLEPDQAERRQRLHEANNRLAAVVMNLAFARATLAACPPDAQLTALERADLATALEHAEDAANRLASVIRELG